MISVGSLPYDFKTVGIDSYEMKFLVRIKGRVMREMFDQSLKHHRKKMGVDGDISIDDPRFNRFSAPDNMLNRVSVGFSSFWKSARDNIEKNSKKRVVLTSRRIVTNGVIFERQDDGGWACLVIFVGEFIDGR